MKAKNLLKKAFLLLALMGGASSAWAQTYTNEATTVTWEFTSGSLGAGVASPNAAVLSSNNSFGSDLQLNSTTTGTCTKNDGTGSYTFTLLTKGNESEKGSNTRIDGRYIDFYFTPAKGLTFTPTSVSFDIVKWGTGDPQFFVDVIEGTNDAVQIANEQVMNKMSSGKMESFDTAPLSHTYNLTENANIVATTDKVTLRIYIGKLAEGKQVGLKNVVISGTVSGTVQNVTVYTITAATNNASLGTVAGTATVEENEEVTLTATPTAAGYFVKWQKDDADFAGNTASSITVTATADATYTAIFEAKKAITFAKGEGTGTVPSTAYVVSGDDYTIPEVYFLYKTGATLTGWSDGVNTYAPGATISNVTTDIDLTAVFTDNTVNLGDAAAIVNWTFDRSSGAPSIACENSETDYVQHTTIGGTRFDAVMHVYTVKNKVIDGSTGKLNNTGHSDKAQMNKGTKLTIPVVNGAVITINGTTGTAAAGDITFGGNNGSVSGAVTTYTYSGATATLDIIDTKGGFYPSGISVAYPTTVNLNASGYATYSNAFDVEVSGANAYIAELNFGTSTITCTEIASDKVPAGNGVLLYGEPGATVTLTPTTGASALGTNNLKATTQANGSLATKGANNYYALDGDTFKKYTGAEFVHNKAYFEVEGSTVLARSMSIVLGDKVTGVENVEAASEAKAKDGKFVEGNQLYIYKKGVKYNAAGQQVK